MSEPWQRMPRFPVLIWRRIYGPWRCDGEGLQSWRERILFSLYFCGVSLALIAFVPGIMRMHAHGGWWVTIVNTLLYAVAIRVLFFPGLLTYRCRALVAVVSLHLIGICVLSMLGPYSGGFVWLFSSAVMSGLLMGVRSSVLALAANAGTLLILGFFLAWGLLPWNKGGMQAAGPWITTSLNLLFLNSITAVSAATMMRGLEQTLVRQRRISVQLKKEREDLIQVRGQLQTLAVELIEAEEKERQRIALLLHDDLQQLLASARMQLHAVSETMPANVLLGNIENLLSESIDKSRHLSHELSPPVLYHSSPFAALQWLIGKMREQFGLQVDLTVDEIGRRATTPFKVFIFRAVQELLFNVIKHSGVREAAVDLSACGNRLVIQVVDQGRGFDPSILNGTRPATGLGLVSLRERASYIGGNFSIESTIGNGCRSRIALPFAAASDEQQPIAPHGQADTGERRERGSTTKIRVLFADDHTVMRQGLIRLLSGQPDIEIAGEASDGQEVVEIARHLQPDVIVMDVALPKSDGIEATRRIKAELPHIRVVGLSMLNDAHVQQAMFQAGAEAFLCKTESTAELLKAIYGILRHGQPRS